MELGGLGYLTPNMPYQVSMMGWVGSGEDFYGLGWVGSRNFGLGWVWS